MTPELTLHMGLPFWLASFDVSAYSEQNDKLRAELLRCQSKLRKLQEPAKETP